LGKIRDDTKALLMDMFDYLPDEWRKIRKEKGHLPENLNW